MIQLKNHNGVITISENVFGTIVGSVVNNCFGVVGMAAAGAKDGIVSLLKKDIRFWNLGLDSRDGFLQVRIQQNNI